MLLWAVIWKLSWMQTIHLIRHGMGYHNEVPSELRHIPSDANFDSHMNETGWAQAQDLRAHLKQQELQVCLLLSSRRTHCMSPPGQHLRKSASTSTQADMKSACCAGIPKLLIPRLFWQGLISTQACACAQILQKAAVSPSLSVM